MRHAERFNKISAQPAGYRARSARRGPQPRARGANRHDGERGANRDDGDQRTEHHLSTLTSSCCGPLTPSRARVRDGGTACDTSQQLPERLKSGIQLVYRRDALLVQGLVAHVGMQHARTLAEGLAQAFLIEIWGVE